MIVQNYLKITDNRAETARKEMLLRLCFSLKGFGYL